MPKTRAEGFSLLEAVVALAIFATGAMALLTWMNTSLRSIRMAEQRTIETEDRRWAMDYLRSINPMAEPSGEYIEGERSLSWTSERLGDPKPSVTPTGFLGAFEVALYRMDAEVRRGRGEPVNLRIRLAGFRQPGETEQE